MRVNFSWLFLFRATYFENVSFSEYIMIKRMHVKFKKVSPSLSAHRRKESQELTNAGIGPAKLSKKKRKQTDYEYHWRPHAGILKVGGAVWESAGPFEKPLPKPSKMTMQSAAYVVSLRHRGIHFLCVPAPAVKLRAFRQVFKM